MDESRFKMRKKEKLLLFGTSGGLQEALEMLDMDKIEVVKYLDNDLEKQGILYNGIEVIDPNHINNYQYDFIVITSRTYFKEIYKQLISLNVDRRKIVSLPNLKKISPLKLIEQHYEAYRKGIRVFKEEIVEKHSKYGIITQNHKMQSKEINFYNYPDYLLKGLDYARLTTVELLARQIEENNIQGVVAELGVYRGDFSKFLSEIFTSKEIYLFDTFEGFDDLDLKIEYEFGLSKAKKERFLDTNENLVREKVLDSNRLNIIKGYFPKSIQSLKDTTYSFVSIDVDLYQPTIAGLIYFYEHLAPGGFIIVHDYNLEYYRGVKKAVDEFAIKYKISFVPVCDYNGSVVINKPL